MFYLQELLLLSSCRRLNADKRLGGGFLKGSVQSVITPRRPPAAPTTSHVKRYLTNR